MGIEPTSAELMNIQLRAHQTTVEDWPLAAVVKDFHGWAERMVLKFKLEIGVPALMTEPLRGRLGHYKIGRKGFGLNDEIAIDRQHAGQSPCWEVLGTLLHELLHSWQEHHGRPPSRRSWNYHNRQFRDKAKNLGLLVDHHGHSTYASGNTPFRNLLESHGVDVPPIPEPEHLPRGAGQSKLKLYMCPCGVKVRVGRSQFNARCLDCDGLFQKSE